MKRLLYLYFGLFMIWLGYWFNTHPRASSFVCWITRMEHWDSYKVSMMKHDIIQSWWDAEKAWEYELC